LHMSERDIQAVSGWCNWLQTLWVLCY